MLRRTLSSFFLDLFGKKKNKKCSINAVLPNEVKLHIFSFLTVQELCVSARVCKHFKELVMDDSLWRKMFIQMPGTKGILPPARVCHSAVVHEDRMYMFGGHVPDVLNYIRDVKNDLWSYHFPSKKWEEVPVVNSTELPYKTEHTAVTYKNCMYLFGGYSNGTMGYRDVSIYEYNFDTKLCMRVEARGAVPPDRSAHTAVVYKDNMYILGGWDGSVSNNDFYMYHFESRTWAQVDYTGIPPPCIRSHSAAVYNDSMVIFGGYGENMHPTSIYIFDFITKYWTTIKPRIPSVSNGEVHCDARSPNLLPSSPLSSSQSPPASPPPSTSASSSFACSSIGPAGGPCGRSRFRMVYYNESLWVFGGWDRKAYFSDLWRFRLDTLTWHIIDTNFDMKGVGQHSLVVYQGYMYLYGGYCADSKVPHPYLYLHRLPKPPLPLGSPSPGPSSRSRTSPPSPGDPALRILGHEA